MLLNLLAEEDLSNRVDQIMQRGVLDVFHAVIQLNERRIQEETFWGLSNIACHSQETLT